MRMSARLLNSSAARCSGVPVPPEEKLNAPGFCRASAMKSLTVFAGTLACSTRMYCAVASSVTGARSRSMLNASLYSAGLTVSIVANPRNTV
jgi:hypothetical protein